MRHLSISLCLIFSFVLALVKLTGIIDITWEVVLYPVLIPVGLAWFLAAARDLVNMIKF